MPSALVYGGAGQLGQAIVAKFNAAGYETTSVDFRANEQAAKNILLKGDAEADVHAVAEKLTADGASPNAIVCAAGGWTGGDVKSKDLLQGVDKMWRFNVQSAVACSHIASHFLADGGLLVLTGAAAALSPTPGMIAYGVTKAATHHLVKSLAANGGGLPNGATVTAILPITLDTATNRAGMPDANFDSWTPLDTVADRLVAWANNDGRPANGALVKLVTKEKVTTFEVAA